MKERIVSVKIAGVDKPVYYENGNGYYEEIVYDKYGRIVYFENPEGCESWEYLTDTNLFTSHTFANGVIEFWEYDFARRVILNGNNLGKICFQSYSYEWLSGSTGLGTGMVLAHHLNKERIPALVLKYGTFTRGQSTYNTENKYDFPASVLLRNERKPSRSNRYSLKGRTVSERASLIGNTKSIGTIFNTMGEQIGNVEIAVNGTTVNLAYQENGYLITKTTVIDTFTGETIRNEESSVKLSKKEYPDNKRWCTQTSKIFKGKSNVPIEYHDEYDELTLSRHILDAFKESLEY